MFDLKRFDSDTVSNRAFDINNNSQHGTVSTQVSINIRPIHVFRSQAFDLVKFTGISRQGRSISYNIRQGDELRHYSK